MLPRPRTLPLLLLLTTLCAPAALPASPAGDCPIDGPLGGVWEAVDAEQTIRFSGREYAFAMNGRLDLVAPVVACRPGRVEICSFGRRHAMDVTVEGDRLEVHNHSTDVRRTYRRADGPRPEVFDPEPLEIPPGEAQRLAAERVEEIRTELARRHELDQEVRQPPFDGPKMMEVDRDNTAYLKKLLRQVGWIDAERFGAEAADAAFLIVQHSGDLPLMKAALPRLRAAGELQDHALLYDRIRIRQGLPQRYGSQLGWAEDGTQGLLPIETLEGIEELRAEMGLEPLDDYLARFGLEERRVLDCR